MNSSTTGKKIGIGFGAVLVLLAAVWLLSFTGVRYLVRDANEIIHGNEFDGILAQKETDHLNWATRVTALLMDQRVEKHFQGDEAIFQNAAATRPNVTFAGGTAIVVSLLLAFFISKGIVGMLGRLAGGIHEGAAPYPPRPKAAGAPALSCLCPRRTAPPTPVQ